MDIISDGSVIMAEELDKFVAIAYVWTPEDQRRKGQMRKMVVEQLFPKLVLHGKPVVVHNAPEDPRLVKPMQAFWESYGFDFGENEPTGVLDVDGVAALVDFGAKFGSELGVKS